MPVRVLVTGANSTVAQSIIKALRASRLGVELYGCDINPYSPGLHRADRAFLVKPYTDPGYERQMLAMIERHRIDVVLPGVEGELQQLARRREAWAKRTGVRVIVNSPALLDVTQDKWLTAKFLASRGLAAPASTIDLAPDALAAFIARVGFPLVVKPRRGATSRHVYVVRDEAELARVLPTVPGPVIQEHLGSADEEYTVGAFIDARGRLRGVAALRRILAAGITGTAIAGRFPDVEAEVARIVAALKPIASFNVQLRRGRDGRPTTFEVNARFSSSVAIRAHFGFNEAEATIRSFVLGEDVPEMALRPGVAMRYMNEVYAETGAVDDLLAQGQMRPQATVEGNF